ncbi:acetyl-CoA hydrolase/transferase family protein [Brevibacillus choshinensis]|uniref:acetyl-CoA hydrolase/transferase family protein n=1 Tax=Brevibacillus choshinensis TaxID=54911 RepID=UPI002E1A8157|nr:acetyl-CoA hydrolase/transferase C-terminal domain-containing protein [Brevibacillus choshinensis]
MMPKRIGAEAVPSLLSPGMRVYVQGSTSEPVAILEALRTQPQASQQIHYLSVVIPGINHTDFAAFHEEAKMTTFFMTSAFKHSFAQEKTIFIPMHFSEIYTYLDQLDSIDVVIIQVSQPDAQGYCSAGVSCDFMPVVLRKAQIVIAEVNGHMPHTYGSIRISLEHFDYIVEVEHPLPQIATLSLTPELVRIGQYAATLIEDGDTLQFGVGSVPLAILGHLTEKQNLGIHSGMICDAVVELVESGVVNGSQKSIDRGKIVTGMAAGTERLYQFVHRNPMVEFRPVSYTHSLEVMKQLDSFVSINSAIEVDLFGQVNAETIHGVQYGGTGGQVDFIRGSRLSSKGRSMIALLATAASGTRSRIVTQLSSGTIVSTARTDVQFIVTEYGIADLRNKSLGERAEALIAVAAPVFRPELTAKWDAHKRMW